MGLVLFIHDTSLCDDDKSRVLDRLKVAVSAACQFSHDCWRVLFCGVHMYWLVVPSFFHLQAFEEISVPFHVSISYLQVIGLLCVIC